MNRFYCPNLQVGVNTLPESESHHCVKVFRHSEGDELVLFAGDGRHGIGKLQQAHAKRTEVVVSEIKQETQRPYYLHIAIAPTKQIDRIEWFVEKAVEFGIDKITFLQTKHSERKVVKLDRIERIMLTAAKQSQTAYLPALHGMVEHNTFLQQEHVEDVRLIATLHEQAKNIQLQELLYKKILVLIGPEGGFTSSEVDTALAHGFDPILLGNKRLRTETAGIFLPAAIYQSHLDK